MDKLLSNEEKKAYKFVPPEKEPSAFQQHQEYIQLIKRKKCIQNQT